jgi:15-cis-phytoene synthase
MTIAQCALIVEKGDPDRFAALLASPVAARAWLVPIYAFNLEVARAAWVSAEPLIAEMRLQFWADVLEDAAVGRVRAHEVALPLAELIAARPAIFAPLQRVVAARRKDTERVPFSQTTELETYLNDTAGALMWAAALALGAPDRAEQVVCDYGYAAGLAAYLRAVPVLEDRGRAPLPDGRAEAIRGLASDGLQRLSFARAGRGAVPIAVRPALLPGWQAKGILRQAETDPAAVAEGRLGLSEFARRGGLLWQALTGRW